MRDGVLSIGPFRKKGGYRELRQNGQNGLSTTPKYLDFAGTLLFCAFSGPENLGVATHHFFLNLTQKTPKIDRKPTELTHS